MFLTEVEVQLWSCGLWMLLVEAPGLLKLLLVDFDYSYVVFSFVQCWGEQKTAPDFVVAVKYACCHYLFRILSYSVLYYSNVICYLSALRESR